MKLFSCSHRIDIPKNHTEKLIVLLVNNNVEFTVSPVSQGKVRHWLGKVGAWNLEREHLVRPRETDHLEVRSHSKPLSPVEASWPQCLGKLFFLCLKILWQPRQGKMPWKGIPSLKTHHNHMTKVESQHAPEGQELHHTSGRRAYTPRKWERLL